MILENPSTRMLTPTCTVRKSVDWLKWSCTLFLTYKLDDIRKRPIPFHHVVRHLRRYGQRANGPGKRSDDHAGHDEHLPCHTPVKWIAGLVGRLRNKHGLPGVFEMQVAHCGLKMMDAVSSCNLGTYALRKCRDLPSVMISVPGYSVVCKVSSTSCLAALSLDVDSLESMVG